jgi:hypothetical protein
MANAPREALDFIVYKKEIHMTQIVPGQRPGDAALKPGQITVCIDKFALTANNITYAAFGEAFQYWRFFPIAKEGWGRIPVWGFAEVVESRHDEIKVGERLYGYFPMSTYLTIDADRVAESLLIDGAPHRADLPSVYNQYMRLVADPAHRRDTEGLQALFRPLFITAYMLEDAFADKQFFGTKQIIISSASSKTALSLAYLLTRSHRNVVKTVGLTSARNLAFTQGLGYYDRVVTYDDIAQLDASQPALFVDLSGGSGIVRAVHTQLAASLKHSFQVGATHWEEIAQPRDLPGPKPVFFFAPDHARRRFQTWGVKAFQSRTRDNLDDFITSAQKWLKVIEGRGPKAVETVYKSILNGESHPTEGHILSLS